MRQDPASLPSYCPIAPAALRHWGVTPPSNSWLNSVERWFRDSDGEAVRCRGLHSVTKLIASIEAYLNANSDSLSAVVRTATAEEILAEVGTGRAARRSITSGNRDTTLETEVKGTPPRPPLKEVARGAQLLDAEWKLVTHGVRMSAYNGESARAQLLDPHYRRAEAEGRALVGEAFKISGTLEVLGEGLEVRLKRRSAPRLARALAAPRDQPNQTETRDPSPSLVLRHFGNQPPSVA